MEAIPQAGRHSSIHGLLGENIPIYHKRKQHWEIPRRERFKGKVLKTEKIYLRLI